MKSLLAAIVLLLLEPTATVSPPAIPQSGVISGFTIDTLPLDATGSGTRYDVGGGNNDASELSGVPWQSLQPGDCTWVHNIATTD